MVRRVVADPRFAADDYTLQVLLLPALCVLALWLRHADPDRDWFVAVPPSDERIDPGAYYEAPRFNALLMAPAVNRMRDEAPDA